MYFDSVLFILLSLFCASNLVEGVQVNFKELGSCPQFPNNQMTFSTGLRRESHTATYSSKLYIPYDIDPNVTAVVNMEKRGNGGWKKNAIIIKMKDVCNALKRNIPETMNELFKAANTTFVCPLPKGNYNIVRFDVKYFKFGPSVRFFPDGLYRGFLKFYRNKLPFGCVKLVFEVKPSRQ